MRIRAVALMLLGALCVTSEARTQTNPPAPASAALPPLDIASGYVVPFRYDPLTMPFLVVQARVNGQGPYPFMVDTGLSSAMIIAKDFAPLLKLRSNSERARLNATVKANGVTVKTLQIETDKPGVPLTVNLVEETATAFMVDFAFMRGTYVGPPLAGVIGAPVLATMTERIDFAHHEMTFYTKPHAPLQVLGATRLPVHSKNSLYFVDIEAEDGASTPLLVDTGASLTTLPLSFRPHLHPTATTIHGHAMVGSYTLGSRWLLPALRVGTLSEPDVTATVADEDDAVLGLNVLTRFTLFLDFHHQQMLVQRAPDYDARRRLQGWTGLHLGQDNTVEGLGPSSPAYKAGVRAGDRLLTIDEKPLAGISDYLVQKRLDGEAGTPLTLTLTRGSALPQTIIVSRAREFDASPTVLDGIMLHKVDTSYLEVRDVAPGSLADKAGLRTGDRIVKLNGKAAKTLTWQDMSEQVQVSPIQMQVTDAQGKHARDIILTLP